MDLIHLTDSVLLLRLEALAGQERGNAADVIEHLAEADRREVVVDAGYSTLFDYCVKTLHYSEAAAFLRIRAARASRDFPRVLNDLRSGALHLDAVMRLSPHLNSENSDTLLTQAAGATKREVLAMVASLDPAAAAPERDVIRWLPSKPSSETANVSPSAGPSEAEGEAPRPTTVIAPTGRIRLGFTADDDFLRMFERLRSLRRHKFPAGGLEDLLKEAVGVMLDKIDPERQKKTLKRIIIVPQRGKKRRVPSAVKKEVWSRDEGRCAYIAPEGRRCESKEFLEYDHIIPWALGGPSDSVDNIRLLCRPHNQRLARRRFGPRRSRALPSASGHT
jgi:hypothetical protein